MKFFLRTLGIGCILLTNIAVANNEVSLSTGMISDDSQGSYVLNNAAKVVDAKLNRISPLVSFHYRYLFTANHYIFGPEIGVDYADQKFTNKTYQDGELLEQETNKFNYDYNLSLYLGYQLHKKTRVYLNLGAAQGQFDFRIIDNDKGVSQSAHIKPTGFFIKTGLSMQVSKHWQAGAGLQYIKYQDKTFTASNASTTYRYAVKTQQIAGLFSAIYQF